MEHFARRADREMSKPILMCHSELVFQMHMSVSSLKKNRELTNEVN